MLSKKLLDLKKQKGTRIKQHLISSILTIFVWGIFSTVATLFGKDAFTISTDLKIIDNSIVNNILNYVLGFVIGVVILFIIKYVVYELKAQNRKNK